MGAVTESGETVWIELKIDSELGEAQLGKQLELAKGGRVVHALLGLSEIRSRPWATELAKNRGGTVLDAVAVSEALGRVSGSEAAQQLAGAYASQLDALRRRGEDFRTARSWWSAHALCFFDRLRNECTEMRNATVAYVANPSGGFEACHWGWTNGGTGVVCYPQWENDALYFKISVKDPTMRVTTRSSAVEFLRNRPLGSAMVRRPKRLGSGQTMTVGVVDKLPVREEAGAWEDLVAAMAAATRINEDLAEHLRRKTPL